MLSQAAAIWESGHLYWQDRRRKGLIARLNGHPEILGRFHHAVDVGAVHSQPHGPYWTEAERKQLLLLAQKLWPYLSRVRRSQFRLFLPDLIIHTADIDVRLPDASWAAGLLTLGTLVNQGDHVRLLLPRRRTLPCSVLADFARYAGGGCVVQVCATCDVGFWQTTDATQFHDLSQRVMPHLPDCTVGRYALALGRIRPPRVASTTASTDETMASDLDRKRERHRCHPWMRAIAVAERQSCSTDRDYSNPALAVGAQAILA